MEKKTWTEFRESGLFWWINNLLHTFGWAIVVELDDNKELVDCYPARVKFRGFSLESNEKGYQKVSKFMKDNAETLYNETMED
jgi:hypothetical protein